MTVKSITSIAFALLCILTTIMCIYKFNLQFHNELIYNIEIYNSLVSEQ